MTADLVVEQGQPTSSPPVQAPAAAADAGGDPRIAGLTGLFQAAGEGSLLLDADGHVVFSGGVADWFLGRSRDEVLRARFTDLVPSEQRTFVADAIERVRNGADEPLFETHWTDHSTGRLMVIALHIAALIEDGTLLGFNVKGFELATRQAADAAVRGDLLTSRQLAERSPLVIFHLDARGQCTFLNTRWTLLTGQQRADALGTGWLNRMSEEERAAFRTMAATAHKQRRGWRHQFVVSNSSGAPCRVDGAAMPLLDAAGATVGYFGAMALVSTALLAPAPADAAATGAASMVAADPIDAPVAAHHDAPAGSAHGPADAAALHGDAHVDAPVAPIERYALPAVPVNAPAPPPLVEGFTAAELLIPTRPSDDVIPPTDATEPAIDKTTGLANRLLFAQHVGLTVSRMQADALTVSLSFVNLHGLEDLRAESGSRAANDYLFLLAKRLEATIRSIEIAGRIEGDVLGVLSINWLFADDLPVVASRLLGRLSEPLAAKDGREVVVPMRLGMAVAHPNESVEELFQRTWSAMEKAKESPDNYEIDLG